MKDSEIRECCSDQDIEDCICPVCDYFLKCKPCETCEERGYGSPVDRCEGYHVTPVGRIGMGENDWKFKEGDGVNFCSLENSGKLEGSGAIKSWTHTRGSEGFRYRVRTDGGDKMIPENCLKLS